MWGLRGGIVVGLYPARFSYLDETGGPRGLIRIGYESEGVVYFINFMGVSPVRERRGELSLYSSELTDSPGDGRRGIRFFPYPADYLDHPGLYPKPPPLDQVAAVEGNGRDEVMTFGFRTEEYPNGAVAFVIARIDSARPNEVEFESWLLAGQTETRSLVLSTTWGNITRLRNAYLKGGTINARQIWPDYSASGFAQMKFWRPSQLLSDRGGDLLFVVGPDEDRPWETQPYPHRAKLLQYYRKKPGTWGDDLRAMVNGRANYWKTFKSVPGGITFENVTLVEEFRQDQTFIYGFYNGAVRDLIDGKPSEPIR